MSRELNIIEDHIIIRDTIGYERISEIEVSDIPSVMDFLKIVYNYKRMTRLKNREDN